MGERFVSRYAPLSAGPATSKPELVWRRRKAELGEQAGAADVPRVGIRRTRLVELGETAAAIGGVAHVQKDTAPHAVSPIDSTTSHSTGSTVASAAAPPTSDTRRVFFSFSQMSSIILWSAEGRSRCPQTRVLCKPWRRPR